MKEKTGSWRFHLSEEFKTMKGKDLLLTQHLAEKAEEEISFGDRISDRIAAFGGSWLFILSFIAILLIWIVTNSFALMAKPFDPYPFILLNLVLSCVAALQAPVIMMSQNRQQVKDRKSAESDFMINMKAEMEIMELHEKLDKIMKKLEIDDTIIR